MPGKSREGFDINAPRDKFLDARYREIYDMEESAVKRRRAAMELTERGRKDAKHLTKAGGYVLSSNDTVQAIFAAPHHSVPRYYTALFDRVKRVSSDTAGRRWQEARAMFDALHRKKMSANTYTLIADRSWSAEDRKRLWDQIADWGLEEHQKATAAVMTLSNLGLNIAHVLRDEEVE